MVEEPQRSVRKDHSMLIGSLDALLVHNASAGRGQVTHAALPRTVYVVGEREESITGTRHAVKFGGPIFLLSFS